MLTFEPNDDVVLYEMFPFDEETRNILMDHNLTRYRDFKDLKIRDLVRLGIEGEKARMVLKYIKKESTGDTGEDVLTLLEKRSKMGKRHIMTFSREVDRILGGGIELGSLTEICGAPGIGKTQLGMQLALNVQLPKVGLDGVEGESLFIDTEGSMFIDRVKAMGNNFVKTVNRALKDDLTRHVNINGVLDKMHYYRIHSYFDQISIVNVLPQILDRNRNIKLVVMDSVAFHFRFGFEDFSLRARILQGIAQKLTKVAYERDVAIVLMNHVTTKLEPGGRSKLIPALGQSWAHACKTRVILYKKDGNRCAFLYKSPTLKPDDALFSITEEGIRDFTKKRDRNVNERM